MKKLLLITLLISFACTSHAQIIKTSYDSIQDIRFQHVQLHLEKFANTYQSGGFLYFVGLGIAGAGLAQNKPKWAMVGIGGGLNILGSLIMIAAHAEVKRAALVKR